MERGVRGQLKLSFGMIFSIILIIVFVIFTFYAIKTFLGVSDSAKAGLFLDDLQLDVDRIWNGEAGSEQKEYDVPTKVAYVCFVDLDISAKGADVGFYNQIELISSGNNNLFFYPIGSAGLNSKKIKNIDLDAITQTDNPYCIESNEGKVQLTLVKNPGVAQVTITR